MTLLREVMERPLDPGYAAAAAPAAPADPAPARRSPLALAIAGRVPARVAVVGPRDPAAARRRRATRSRLRQEIAARTDGVDDAARRRTPTCSAAIAADAGGGARPPAAPQLAGQARHRSGWPPGSCRSQGPGCGSRSTTRRAAEDAVGGDPRADADADGRRRRLDSDLQVVVNGLWAAGAEAIAVNGQRLTGAVGDPVGRRGDPGRLPAAAPPYVVDAIGDPAPVQTGFAAGAAGAYLQSLRDNCGIIRADDRDQRRGWSLPGAGPLVLRAPARPARQRPATGSPHPRRYP